MLIFTKLIERAGASVSQKEIPIGIFKPVQFSCGACIGILVSMITVYVAIAATGMTTDFNHPHILPSAYTEPLLTVKWQERFESLYFFLAVPLAVVSGLTARPFLVKKPAWACALSLAVFIPALAYVCAGLFRDGSINVIGLLICIAALLLVFAVPDAESPSTDPHRDSPAGNLGYWLFFPAYLLLVAASLAPASFSSLATTLTDPHVGSWLMVPAINSLSPQAITAVDFESHYGLGHALLFSKLVGNSFEQTTYRAAFYLWALCVAFYASVFWLAAGIYRSAFVAATVSLLILASGFDGFSFSLPSNMPIRYVMAPACLWICLHASMSPRPGPMSALCGVVVACAIFWQTDTGLQIAISCGLYVLILTFMGKFNPLHVLLFVASTILCFSLFLLGLVGVQSFWTALARLAEPISLYSGGFGGVLVTWQPGWSYVYNIAAPVVLAVSVAMAITAIGREGKLFPAQLQNRALLILAAFSFLTLMKWANRSIDVLWWLNGWPVIILLGIWWIKATCYLSGTKRLALGSIAILLMIGALNLSFGQDIILGLSRAPASRWAHYFNLHPGVLSDLVHRALGQARDPASRRHDRVVSTRATDIVRKKTQDGERVAILSRNDWHYHVDAPRPSALHWLPLHLTHSHVLLDRNASDIQHAQRLFLEDGYWQFLKERNASTYERVRQIVDQCFVAAEVAEPWTIMRNRCDAQR